MAAQDGALTIHQQSPPELGNQFQDDPFLRQQLKRLIPEQYMADVNSDLDRFGWEVATTIKDLGRQAEDEPPTLVKADAWGRRLDRLVTSPGWRGQKVVSAREGLIAIPYEARQGAASRIVQAAKLYLYGASSGLFNCPLAMTDGATRLAQMLGPKHPELAEAFQHLTSRDPEAFWTSGQWMTEKAGGSDVAAGTETVAVPETGGATGPGSWFVLRGYKWFTSAADGEMAMTLARELDARGQPIPGNRGLSMFYVPIRRDAQGAPDGFTVVRLKDKLGTKQLPTAELELTGLRALKVSALGRGVPTIASMVNITRYHNALAASSLTRRMAALCADYARRRVAFGKVLSSQPLAVRTLGWLTGQAEACLALSLEVARLLGSVETGVATPEDAALLRVLTPLTKLFTAKRAVAVCSEGLEFFGGLGYIESSGLPGLLRDAQVLPIWEGTTNVLSLDLLRALSSDTAAGPAYSAAIAKRLAAARAAVVGNPLILVRDALPRELQRRATVAAEAALERVTTRLADVAARGPGDDAVQAGARELAMDMSSLMVAVLLLEHAADTGSLRDGVAAAEWARTELPPCAEFRDDPRDGTAARLHAAVLLARVDEPVSLPRAKF